MSEIDVVYSKINIIKNCLFALEKARKKEKDRDFLFALYSVNLQRAVQASIDLANVVIAKEGLGLPSTYRMSFEILHQHQIIDQSLLKIMVGMVGFRNIAVHSYQDVKSEILESLVANKLSDFEKFYSVVYTRAKAW